MQFSVSLAELPELHPSLWWDSLIAAAVLALKPRSINNSAFVEFAIESAPNSFNTALRLEIDLGEVSRWDLARLSRTFDSARRIELAAIAIAGLAVYYLGRHRIGDAAIRGSGGDYHLDEGRYLLEVSGRSRRSGLAWAWNECQARLRKCADRPWCLVVIEFEWLTGRIGFGP
jgi:hypothetical protein